ncbi:MAG: hypothetical protein NC217_05930 [Muribaculaceae bacterium]|nr:hypothetical protein [Muribaculaceae bacterium]
MSVLLFIILTLVACLALVVGFFIIMHKYNDGRGNEANRSGLYRACKNLAIGFAAVIVILSLIYGFVPYEGTTGFSPYTSGVVSWLSWANMLRILVVELMIGSFFMFVARYRGSQRADSKYADPQYLKQYNQKVLIWTNIIMAITLLVLIMIKYVF